MGAMKVRGTRSLLGAALLLAATGSSAESQEPPELEQPGEFFWGLDVGAAHLDMDCGRCTQLPDSLLYSGGAGMHLGFLLGRSLSTRVLLGVAGNLNFVTDGEQEAVLGRARPWCRSIRRLTARSNSGVASGWAKRRCTMARRVTMPEAWPSP